MAAIVDQVINIINKPSYKRSDQEIEPVLQWLRKRSLLLDKLDRGILLDIMKNCTYQSCSIDDIIIRQGEKGDSFYVILSGTSSVYIDPRMTGEDEGVAPLDPIPTKKEKPPTPRPSSRESHDGENSDNEESQTEEEKEAEAEKKRKEEEMARKLVKLDRSKFGKYIMTYEPGKAFGEVALVKRDSLRNATIIADEPCDLMVIDQDLYERSLKADQEREFQQISDFIDGHPYFRHMSNKFKKLLEMSLHKVTYSFDSIMLRQGDPVQGLHFILNGQAKITVEPNKHPKQYIDLWPFEAGIDVYSEEFEYLRESRRQAVLRKYEDPSVWDTMPEDLVVKRTEGYAAAEKRMKGKHMDLCSVHSGEAIGDTETLLNLSTYLQTVKCTATTEVFYLDSKNFERLIGKRNVQTTDKMREVVIEKLKTRMAMKQGNLIPILQYLHHKLTAQQLPAAKTLPPLKTSKTLPDKDTQKQYMLQWFKEGKVPLVDSVHVPGGLYYKSLMHQKAKQRAIQRKAEPSQSPSTSNFKSTRRMPPIKRQPRSVMAIRESLRQMMEAEVINIDTNRSTKKLKSKFGSSTSSLNTQHSTHPPVGGATHRKSSTSETPRKFPPGVPDFDHETSPIDNNNNFIGLLSKKKDNSRKSPRDNDKSVEDSIASVAASNDSARSEKKKTGSKPGVLVTEKGGPKQEPEIILPSIVEERTQEELNLKTPPRATAENIGMHIPKLIDEKATKPANNQKKDGVTIAGKFFPAIKDATEAENKGPSKWGTAMKFVNKKVQDKLAEKLLEAVSDESNDYDVHNYSMRLLENKIDSFNIKYGGKAKVLPPLARFNISEDDPTFPRPGGKVYIKRRNCRFSDHKIQVKDHEHVRHYIVEELPQFEKVSVRSHHDTSFDSASEFSEESEDKSVDVITAISKINA